MSRIYRISFLFLALTAGLTLAFAVFPAAAGPNNATLYAAPTPNGAGDCSSWADACTLQTALSNAVSGDQIWVEMGVHKPGVTVSDTFALVNGVAIYGGFDGTETALEQRDWETNITVLSGDVDNNDLTDPNGVVTNAANIVGRNAYQVVRNVTINASTLLDGFILTGGQANGSYPNYDRGGGMYNKNSAPHLQNVIFSGNAAFVGGGIFINNESSLTLVNVTFDSNFSEGFGGGIYNNGTLTLTQGIFRLNVSDSAGGGMVNVTDSHATLTQVTFLDNSASGGGGGMANSTANIKMVDGAFIGNFSEAGGGMSNNASDPTLINVIFYDNIATVDGGGIYNESSSPTLINVTFHGNTAQDDGGGMCNKYYFSDPILINVILWGNEAVDGGGDQIYNFLGVPFIANTNIQDSNGSGSGWYPIIGIDGGGNVDIDPLFVDPANGDLHLQPTSPVIDAGDNESITITTDLDGNLRFVDILAVPDTGNGISPIVDMGAYEAQVIEYRIYIPLVKK